MPSGPGVIGAAERSGPAGRRLGLGLGTLAFALVLAGPALGLDWGLEPAARRTAAVTALVAILWLTSALPLAATSLLPAVLFPVLGVLPAGRAAEVYMADLVMLFLGAFVVALGVERWGLHRRAALSLVVAIGARPVRLVLGFMLAAAVLSMWISNTAATLMMLPIALATAGAVEGSEPGTEEGTGDRSDPAFAQALLLGVAYAASIGGIATPVGTPTNQMFLGQFAQRFPDAPAIGFGPWVVAWLPLSVGFVGIAWWLLTRVLFRVRATTGAGGETLRAARSALGPMGRAERTMAAVFALTALLWVTRADLELGPVTLPGWSRLLGAAGGQVTDATVALAMAVLCFALPVGRGEQLMDWRTAERLPWDVLLLVGGGFCIALAFRESGLDAELGSLLAPWLAGRPSWQVVCLIALSMTFLTEVTSNTATTGVLLPVLAGAALAAGVHPLVCMLPATVAASAAFMLPVATPPNAVVFASRRVPVAAMARAGLVLNLVGVVVLTVVFELWVRRVLDIEDGLPPWAH